MPQTRSGREFSEYAMDFSKIVRLAVPVDLADLLHSAESAVGTRDGDHDLSAPESSEHSPPFHTDPDDLPSESVIFAYADPPPARTQAPTSSSPAAVSTRKMTPNALNRARAYVRQKQKERSTKANEERTGPKLSVDTKLAQRWLEAAQVVIIRDVDIAKARMCSTGYYGRSGELPGVSRFVLPILGQLIAAGFRLIRWNAWYVLRCDSHSQN